jgi:(4S)-4-hydroxy-5-phosphonooxypentane-2,3-dione isomerase
MLILHVYVHVKPEMLDAFIAATIDNARNSRKEAGVVRFDFVQQTDDPARFMLLEVYRDQAAMDSHRQMPHYHAWAAKVPDMLAEPRSRQIYRNIDPGDSDW